VEAKDHARRQDASKAQDTIDATTTANIRGQEAGTMALDSDVAREAAAKTSSGNTEDEAGAGAEVANQARTTQDTNGANDAQQGNNARSDPSSTASQTNLTNAPVGSMNVAQTAVSPRLHEESHGATCAGSAWEEDTEWVAASVGGMTD
jgi:hypothetical protein